MQPLDPLAFASFQSWQEIVCVIADKLFHYDDTYEYIVSIILSLFIFYVLAIASTGFLLRSKDHK